MGYGTGVISPNFATRTIWTGDNLDILRGLNSASVDLVYLDPPFNSNAEYAAPVGSQAAGAAFKDTWTLSDLDVAWTGYIADEYPAVAYILAGAGMAHGKGMRSYLTMMAVRLLEMRRILKSSGSLYLHCDDTASAYLKTLCDAIFGQQTSRAQIVWRRYGAHNDAKGFGRVYDVLLFYALDGKGTWNGAWRPHDPEYVRKSYRYDDNDGKGPYTTSPLHADGLTGGRSEYEFRGHFRAWKHPIDRMLALEEEGLIHQARDGSVPRRKIYLRDSKGRPTPNLWDDIAALVGDNAERTGYPTQKPLALLERIISASSNPGDMVLDPFCGCATACIAAERLERQWVGIDISAKAVELVNDRLRDELGDLFHHGFVTARSDIPRRTDIDTPKNYRTHKHELYGEQEGRCAGCTVHFEFRNLTIDHLIPRKKGGTDHKSNLQLLCGHCNSIKGDRPMEYLLAELRDNERLVTP